MGIIRVKNAFKEFKSCSESKVVLKNFNLNVHKGSIYALMGASGCGKTTLMSCLMGMCSLDKGEVEVFDHHRGAFNNFRIGFMPQEIALIKEFTIREIVYFFGTIWGMTSDKIGERLQVISQLLDLPNADKLIRDCSGGQQRRVSFALTLVHEPELLILDEPTVGLDPVLRVKIWDYLVDITRRKNVTVLLSTHYIEEARQSTHVGFMRNGSLLTEDTPQNLLEQFEVATLQEVFLKLSQDQENGSHDESIGTVVDCSSVDKSKAQRISLPPSEIKIMKALLTKNLIQVIRNPGIILLAVVIPLISIIGLHYSIGGNPHGLQLGIVDEEIESFDECFVPSMTRIQIRNYQCKAQKVSCHFLRGIEDDFVLKKFYSNQRKAFDDVKKGKIIGFISFARNFSSDFFMFRNHNQITFQGSGTIQVHLDNTDLQIVSYLQKNIIKIYHNFIDRLAVSCRKSRGVGNITPMIFQTFHGSMFDEFKRSMVPGLLMASFFSVTTFITAIALIDDRRSGIWSRAIISGVAPYQFLLSHLIIGTVIMTLQLFEYVAYSFLVGSAEKTLSILLLIPLLMFLVGFAGILFGLCISTLTDSIMVATSVASIAAFPFILLSGTLWPLQGATTVLKYIGYFMPFTLPSQTYSGILYKTSDLNSSVIYLGFLVLFTWVILELMVCFRASGNANKK